MHVFEFAEPIEHHPVLNPKIWEHDSLKGQVRGALLRMAQDFEEFIGIPLDIKDVVITGGNANYTYTAKSDIDLHLIADLSGVDCDRAVEELLDAKRLLYKRKYTLSVMGIPVELYVEDTNSPPAVSAGCYSVMNDHWIRQPQQAQEYDRKQVKTVSDAWRRVIQAAIKTANINILRKFMHLLRTYRQQGLRAEGEFGVANLAYKSLRNDSTIEAAIEFLDHLHDKTLSIN